MMLNESETSDGQSNAKKGDERDQRTNGDVVAITDNRTNGRYLEIEHRLPRGSLRVLMA